MRNVQISLVGKQPSGALAALKVPPPVDHLVLLHSGAPESLHAAREVQSLATKLPGTTCELAPVDAFDMDTILRAMIEVRRAVGRADTAHITVAITGGTNIMAGAACLGCLLIGADAIYIREDISPEKDVPLEERVLLLPIPRIPPEKLSEPLRDVLCSLPMDPGEEVERAPTYLMGELGLVAQTASYRLKKLANLGLVVYSPAGRTRTASLTNQGRLFAALLSRKPGTLAHRGSERASRSR